MANYNCVVRTNYFHVKDVEAFTRMMDQVVGSVDEVKLWEETDQDGNPVFAFGCYSEIEGLPNDTCEDDEYGCIDDDSYEHFIDGLKKCIADNDAVIVMEAGNEKLRYVVGSAIIITSSDTKYLDITKLAVEEAGKMLGTNFTTRVDY